LPWLCSLVLAGCQPLVCANSFPSQRLPWECSLLWYLWHQLKRRISWFSWKCLNWAQWWIERKSQLLFLQECEVVLAIN
jgi:hypothetical protein